MLFPMKILFTLLVMSFSLHALAEEVLFLPIQDFKLKQLEELRPIEFVKVKVFPHDGKYATPQGVEGRMDQAEVKSEGNCELVTTSGVKRGSVFTLKAQDYSAGPGTLKCDSPMTLIREGARVIRYRGNFTIHKVGQKLMIVNVVTFKEYLSGVVPTEMSTSWPLESLKAQAIAARTYAVNQILGARRTNPKAPFDLDDTVMYQAYLGLNLEHPASTRAVEETDGNYLLDSKGKPIIAYFSADSGGYTESAENVWGTAQLSYTPSKPEIYDPRLVKSSWKVNLTMPEIEKKLINRGVVPQNYKLTRFEILEYTTSGRIKRVKLISEDQQEMELAGEKFRYGLTLRSSLFKVTGNADGLYEFNGLGWGHGVGMNQTGAKVLVESMGWDHKQILEFYYEGVQI